MQKSSRKTNKKSQRRSAAFRGNRNDPVKQRTCRASGTEQPYTISENNGTSGILNSQVGILPPPTGNRYVPILPSSIGNRCDQLARLYNQWRINSVTYVYKPRYHQVTLSSDQTPPIQTGNQAAAAFGILLDATMGDLTQQEVVEAGGRWQNLGDRFSMTLRRTKWMYTAPRATDTLSDIRFVSPGNLYAVAESNGDMSTTSVFGYLETHWDISFRFPLDSDVDAVTTPQFGASLLKQIQLQRQGNDESKQQQIGLCSLIQDDDTKSQSSVIVNTAKSLGKGMYGAKKQR